MLLPYPYPIYEGECIGGIRLHACLTALFDPAVFYVRIGKENNLMLGSGSGSGVGGYRRSICHAFMGGLTGAVATLVYGVGVLDGEMEVASLSVIFVFPFCPPFLLRESGGLECRVCTAHVMYSVVSLAWTLCVLMSGARCFSAFLEVHGTYVAGTWDRAAGLLLVQTDTMLD
jgi:hypothetical protein